MAPRLVGGSRSPRDLVLNGSADSVSDSELIALMMGEACDSSARMVLESYPTAHELWRACGDELTGLPGVGPAKAARLLACLEMSRRAGSWRPSSRPAVHTPEDVVQICGPQLRGCDREHFWALALSTKNLLLKVFEVSIGSLNASIVHPRELFRDAVRVSAASVVVLHNHPSGDPTPSGADIQLTRRLVKAGDVLGIEVLDHVIIGDEGQHRSMREAGLM